MTSVGFRASFPCPACGGEATRALVQSARPDGSLAHDEEHFCACGYARDVILDGLAPDDRRRLLAEPSATTLAALPLPAPALARAAARLFGWSLPRSLAAVKAAEPITAAEAAALRALAER